MYIKLTILSKDNLSLKERKVYLDKLQESVIDKFISAIGLKNVETSDSSSYLEPNYLLYSSLTPSFNKNEICSFVSERQIYKHKNKDFTYGVKQLYAKLKSFLEKVFPYLIFNIEELDGKEILSVNQFVLNEFLLQIKNRYTTIEVSSPRLLEDKELKEIETCLKPLVDFDFSINQNYCKTCEEYSNGKTPYHIEIIY